MEPWDARFPVGAIKRNILSKYSEVVGFSTVNYDVEFTRDFVLTASSPPNLVASNMKYMPTQDAIRLKQYLTNGLPVLLTVGYPGHAVAYIIDGTTIYVFDTQKTETNESLPIFTSGAIEALFGMEFTLVDALAKDPTLNIQTDDDNYCVIWMLFILELVAFSKKNIGSIGIPTILSLIKRKLEEGGGLAFIEKIHGEYIAGHSYMSGGSRICSCSPDTGDCPKCKKGCTVDKMSCQDGGKRKTTKKWIQDVVAHMKEGAFTKQAVAHHETPMQYAQDVLKHPKKHILKTRRRAQFLKNIAKGKKSRKSSRYRK